MRKWILLALVMVAVPALAQQTEQSPKASRAGWDIHLAVLPTAEGTLAGCRMDSATEADSGRVAAVVPSDAFIRAACQRLARETGWLVSRDEDGTIKETFDSCRLMSVNSDQPLCRVDEEG